MHMILTIIAQGFAPRYTWFHQRRRINHLFEVDKKYKRDYNLFFLFGSTIPFYSFSSLVVELVVVVVVIVVVDSIATV